MFYNIFVIGTYLKYTMNYKRGKDYQNFFSKILGVYCSLEKTVYSKFKYFPQSEIVLSGVLQGTSYSCSNYYYPLLTSFTHWVLNSEEIVITFRTKISIIVSLVSLVT